MAALHDLPWRHGDGLRRYFLRGCKPSFPYLLLLASFVQVYHNIAFPGVEIRRGIVEGNVGILTDADEADIDRSLPQLGSQGRNGVWIAVHQMAIRQRYL